MSKLGKELFELVEHHQTEALITSSVEVKTETEIMKIAMRSYTHHREVSKRLAEFIRTHHLRRNKK